MLSLCNTFPYSLLSASEGNDYAGTGALAPPLASYIGGWLVEAMLQKSDACPLAGCSQRPAESHPTPSTSQLYKTF